MCLCLFVSQQALPDDSYTTEDHDVFTIAGRTCIEDGNIAQVLSIVLDEKNQVCCSKLTNVSGRRFVHKCVALHNTLNFVCLIDEKVLQHFL